MTFAVCLNCIDGRTQLPLLHYITNNYPVKYVDLVTEPGMIKLLTGKKGIKVHIQQKIILSIEKHHSKILFIAAHHNCAVNQCSDAVHKEQIIQAVSRISSRIAGLTVVGLWINGNWQVEKIIEITS